ncbi:hypothetical protein [Gephyromycinifex aptenodytis]|uniref:hypothetical protein n=1 Tax=Gephyromycinifex aptenodytis TaxID=2716227 RepID=UPI001444EC40|nr:hypothetical protein [Gephyromycinifex aptenodytis]
MSSLADLVPEEYPWACPRVAGVLRAGRFVPHPDPVREVPPGGRAVLAVGSNASPTVLATKLPRASAIPLLPAELHEVAIGHSAHVSRRGYLAAAPYACRGARTPVVLTWLSADDLAALDATEPNYERITLADLGGSVTLALGRSEMPDPREVDLYSSRHGLISHLHSPEQHNSDHRDRDVEHDGHGPDGAPGAHPLPLMPQGELFALLAGHGELAALLGGSPAQVCARLAGDPAAREHVRRILSRGACDPRAGGASEA